MKPIIINGNQGLFSVLWKGDSYTLIHTQDNDWKLLEMDMEIGFFPNMKRALKTLAIIR